MHATGGRDASPEDARGAAGAGGGSHSLTVRSPHHAANWPSPTTSASTGPRHSRWSDAAFAEIVYTFVLCFVVLNVAAQAAGSPLSKVRREPSLKMLPRTFSRVN